MASATCCAAFADYQRCGNFGLQWASPRKLCWQYYVFQGLFLEQYCINTYFESQIPFLQASPASQFDWQTSTCSNQDCLCWLQHQRYLSAVLAQGLYDVCTVMTQGLCLLLVLCLSKLMSPTILGRDLHAGRRYQHKILCVHAGEGQKVQQKGPDISLLSPALQKQWDHAANAHMGNIVVKPKSGRIASWSCNACPNGYLHQWIAKVYARSNGTGCPQCSGRKVCKHNCLATVAPWAAAQWDYEANAALGTPDTVVAHSHQPAGWHCQVCGHRWTATPNARVNMQSGCPKRAPKGTVTTHPTFAECQHPLLAEWDHTRNEACGNYPHNTKLRSGKHIFWLCTKCPARQEHSWSAAPDSRTARNQSGCPMCAGRVACRCNSLQALFPAIAAEWDYDRNKGHPGDYTARSHHLAWWYTPERGSWQHSINTRTDRRHLQNKQKET